MNTVFYAFVIVFSIIIILALLTLIVFAWVIIIGEAAELVNKKKAAKESEVK